MPDPLKTELTKCRTLKQSSQPACEQSAWEKHERTADPVTIANEVRAVLREAPGNPELDNRWKWAGAFRREKKLIEPLPEIVIPGTNGGAALVIPTTKDFALSCTSRAAGCYSSRHREIIMPVPLANGPHLEEEKVPWKVRFEAALLHELQHADKGAGEFKAHIAQRKYMAALGYQPEPRREVVLFHIVKSYIAKPADLGASVREAFPGEALSPDALNWLPFNPGGPLRTVMTLTWLAARKEKLERLEETLRDAIKRPERSKWMREFAQGFMRAGPVDLSALEDEDRKKVEALLRLAKKPTPPTPTR